ncbi:hypothetical protein RRG08_021286 [Elysia crispata]|uniref:Uncharacterized protein n=1 Tax=Elysia crispata TaxID=231223 RepID=A0AAE0ZA52_9GAST|nr:hypothetical protein RRG08_021286 [Elysia crispata]
MELSRNLARHIYLEQVLTSSHDPNLLVFRILVVPSNRRRPACIVYLWPDDRPEKNSKGFFFSRRNFAVIRERSNGRMSRARLASHHRPDKRSDGSGHTRRLSQVYMKSSTPC